MTLPDPAERADVERMTTEIARKHGCDRGTFTVCWAEHEKGLACSCKQEATALLKSRGRYPRTET